MAVATETTREEKIASAALWIRENEMSLFGDGTKVSDARKMFIKSSGVKISPRLFAAARNDSKCRYWKTAKLRTEHPSGSLTEMEWVAVTRAVKELAVELQGVGVKIATKILRTKVHCRESMLRELPKDIQFWNKIAGREIAGSTILQQYQNAKTACEGAILLFRTGDFYESFYDDAKVLAKALGLTLTSRNSGSKSVAMAGFPYHQLESHLGKIVAGGHRVAVCEPIEEIGKASAKREVTRVVTPGKLTEATA